MTTILFITMTKCSHFHLGRDFHIDQRSTILAVDNMNGAHILDRRTTVDHAGKYRLPKKAARPTGDQPVFEEEDEDTDYFERRKRIWDYGFSSYRHIVY